MYGTAACCNTKCPVSTQASSEGVKTLYHEQDKQTEDCFFFSCFENIQDKERGRYYPQTLLATTESFLSSLNKHPEVKESVKQTK